MILTGNLQRLGAFNTNKKMIGHKILYNQNNLDNKKI